MSTSLCRNWRGSRSWGLLCWALLAVSPGARAELTLPEAERLALAADPAVVGAYARADALQNQAVADGQLPDPKLGFGAYNVPLYDFSLDQEPMTQLYTRVQQTFPRGDTLRYQRQHTEWLGKAELAQAQLARRQCLGSVVGQGHRDAVQEALGQHAGVALVGHRQAQASGRREWSDSISAPIASDASTTSRRTNAGVNGVILPDKVVTNWSTRIADSDAPASRAG